MSFSFNLIDAPWIPCAMLPDGAPEEVSLRDTLTRMEQIREVTDASPLVTISIYRLLLAIAHRTHGPASTDEWERLWNQGCLDRERVEQYLDAWRHRFDLFDAERPFYQTTEVSLDYARSIAQMVYGLTLGNYVTLFDHSRQDRPPELRPAEAARHVLAIQSFAVGGLVPYQSQHGEPASPYKYAQNALLTKGAVVLVRGRNLFETLMLNLHRYNGAAAAPFTFDPEKDAPAWEREDPARAGDRLPDGYLDLLTWQSRRVRLQPELSTDGSTVVRTAVVMKGHQLPSGEAHPRNYETMLAYGINPRATSNQDPWPVLSLRPDRSVWRDSSALFQASGAEHRRPRTLDWVSNLLDEKILDARDRRAADVYGMVSDRASVELWRHEQLPLPFAVLNSQDLFHELQRALELAETVSRLFSSQFVDVPGSEAGKTVRRPSPMRTLAEELLPAAEGTRPDQAVVSDLVASIQPSGTYWSRLETPFRRFIVGLGDLGSETARHLWSGEVRAAAQAAWTPVYRTFDASARALRATVNADRQFELQLNALLRQYEPAREEHRRDEAHATPAEVH